MSIKHCQAYDKARGWVATRISIALIPVVAKHFTGHVDRCMGRRWQGDNDAPFGARGLFRRLTYPGLQKLGSKHE